MRRVVAVLTALAAVVVLIGDATSASADDGSAGRFSDEVSASGSILDGGAQAVAEHTSTSPGSSGGGHRSGGSVVCRFYDDGTGEEFNPGAVDPSVDHGDGIQITRVCVDSATGDQVSFDDGLIWQPRQGAPRMDPRTLAQLQVSRLAPPTPGIGTNPGPDADQVVRVPTWLWVQSGWAPLAATATAAGVTATVTAMPTRVVWNMGDGGSVTCAGPGVAYDQSRPASEQHTDCSYTYQHTSAGQPGEQFTVTATVYWTVTFTSNAAPGGVLGEVSASRSFPLRVTQAQALND